VIFYKTLNIVLHTHLSTIHELDISSVLNVVIKNDPGVLVAGVIIQHTGRLALILMGIKIISIFET
jgi:hypothetical protein